MNKITFFLFLLCVGIINAQEYEISSYQKISENSGGFTEVLNSFDWLGYTVESIGDLNNDGINDVAVSAIFDDDGGSDRGAIYIMFLNADGTVNDYQKISDTQGGFSGILDDSDIFGASISYLGDMNYDGLIELAVGAEYDGDGGYWHGAVWILSINTDGTVASYIKISDTQGGFTGVLGDEDVFGSDIESIGDLNGDGNPDIVVGARRDPDGGSDRGALWILFLNSDFTVSSYQKISATEGNFNGVLNAGDYFGGAVANIGDLNGDGVIDLAVGAYRDDGGGLNHGAIYILFLNSDGTVNSYQKINESVGGFNESFNGNDIFFGISIDTCADINEDGLTEIIVGAPGYLNQSNERKGAFYILNLNSDGTVASHQNITEGLNGFNGVLSNTGSFGFSVSYIGALEQDHSVIISEYKDSTNGIEKGSAWVIQFGGTAVTQPDATCAINNVEVTCKSNTITLDYTIYNTNGTAILPSGIPIAFYANNEFIGSSNTQNEIMIGAEESGSVSLSVPLNFPNQFTLTVVVDDDGNANGSVSEIDEANNSVTIQVELIYPNIANVLEDLSECEMIANETAIFDLTVNSTNAIGNQTNVSVSYYNSETDAEAGVNEITNSHNFESVSNSQDIYVRVESNVLPDCYSIGEFHLNIEEVGKMITFSNLEFCKEESSSIDLTSIEDQLGPNMTVIGYYTSENDLRNATNEIVNPIDFNSMGSSQEIYIQLESTNDSCGKIGFFELKIHDCTVVIPDGFSPNNDGINDTFKISGFNDTFQNVHLTIYSRYGNRVYEGNNKPEWDGTGSKGKKLPVGTYYYVLNSNLPNYEVIKGWIYLMR